MVFMVFPKFGLFEYFFIFGNLSNFRGDRKHYLTLLISYGCVLWHVGNEVVSS